VNTEKRERKEEYNHERNCETDLKNKNYIFKGEG
jgi:hypothetical protein